MKILLAASVFMLSATWAFSTPLGAAPDEPDHYVRALGVAQGQFLGRPVEPSLAQFHSSPVTQVAEQSARVASTGSGVRAAEIPNRLLPGNMGCTAFQPSTTGDCYRPSAFLDGGSSWVLTRVGPYPPIYYALVGIPMLAAGDTQTAILVGRVFSGLVAVGLILAALRIVVRRTREPVVLLSFFLASTPLTVFVVSTINPSSWEFAGAFVAGATIAALAGSNIPLNRREWITVGIGLAVLGSSRATGPMFIAIALGLLVATQGVRGARRIVQGGGGAALFAVALAFGATLFTVLWSAFVVGHSSLNLPLVLADLPYLVVAIPGLFVEQVGVLGWLDTRLPEPLYGLWLFFAAFLVILALDLGSRSQRRLIAGLLVFVVTAPLIVWTLAFSDLRAVLLEGRWFMAATIWLLLISGMVVADRFPGSSVFRILGVAGVVFWVCGQGISWFVAARRYSVGANGPLDFWNHGGWQPLLGWGPWGATLCVCLLALCWLTLVWVRSLSSPTPRERLSSGEPPGGLPS